MIHFAHFVISYVLLQDVTTRSYRLSRLYMYMQLHTPPGDITVDRHCHKMLKADTLHQYKLHVHVFKHHHKDVTSSYTPSEDIKSSCARSYKWLLTVRKCYIVVLHC